MFQHLPFPYEGGVFPKRLGAVVQLTVLDGEEPARLVIHDEASGWAVGDGINDPNEPGAAVATHISHVVERNSSVAGLADLPAGHMATRTEPGRPWVRAGLVWADDDSAPV